MINSVLSSTLPITYGVPQGSILGPLLFTLYINDLDKCVKKCSLQLYADDTVLYFSDKSPKVIESVLNNDLNNLYTWMCSNRLSVNESKTVCMLIGNRQMLSKCNELKLTLCKSTLEQVHFTKYLGLIVDNQLKWDVHIENMIKKIGRVVSYLGRLRKFLSESILKLIYNTTILPLFDYADLIYDSAPLKYTSSLQKLQNRAGRIILKLNYQCNISSIQIHDSLQWNTLKDRRSKHTKVMMFKILHDFTPMYLKRPFLNQYVTKSTRYYLNLRLPKPNSEALKRSFCYRGINEYNTLPNEIKLLPSVLSFKNKVI